MRVATGPAFLESVANHPRVIRAIGCTAERFEAGESWKDSIGLEWDTGGIVFIRHAPGWYSVHLVFLPKTPDVLGKCAEAARHMFTQTDARVLTGDIPTHLRHACRVARKMMIHVGDQDGRSLFRLTAEEWKGL
jgi:hypothetical protein